MIVPSSEHNLGEVKYRQAGVDRVILSISADYSVACNSTLYDVFYVPQLPVFLRKYDDTVWSYLLLG